MVFDPTADTPVHRLYDANRNPVVAYGWDADTNEMVFAHVGGGAQHRLNAAGDYDVEGDLSIGGTFQPSTSTPDVLQVGSELALPSYADNANAVQSDARVWFNDGSGPQAAGIYFYDGGVVGPLATGAGSAPGSISGIDWDSDKDLNGFSLTGAGPDGVDVPSSVALTVDDFESGVLSDAYEGDTGSATVQSSVVESGSHALSITDLGSFREVYTGGLRAHPQAGDTFTYFTYLTDEADESRFRFAKGELSATATQHEIRVHASDNSLIFRPVDGASISNDASISNYLNEWLQVTVQWGVDGAFTIELFDSGGDNLATVNHTDDSRESGAIGFGGFNSSNSTIYFDTVEVERRTREYLTETQQGTTELGNEVTPSGGVHTGPQEVPPDHPNYPVVNLPVTAEAAQGDTVGYHLALDEEMALTVEGEADGDGGVQNKQVTSHFPLSTGSAVMGKATVNDELDFGDITQETLSGGSIDSPAVLIRMAAESGSADTLATINGGESTQFVILQSNGDDITVEHGTDNILLDGGTNKSVTNARTYLTLLYDGNNWIQVSYASS